MSEAVQEGLKVRESKKLEAAKSIAAGISAAVAKPADEKRVLTA